MKKFRFILFLVVLCTTWSCFFKNERIHSLYRLRDAVISTNEKDSLFILPAPLFDQGSPEKGLQYFVNGTAFSSGIPLSVYQHAKKLKNSTIAQWAGYGKYALNEFGVFKNEDGLQLATPGCMHCHAQIFNDSLIMGLGNSYTNFKGNPSLYMRIAKKIITGRFGMNSKEWEATEMSFLAYDVLKKKIRTQVQGPTPAQKIAEVMSSHRDPVSLIFREDTSYFPTSYVVIPEDVPALWISKKRKALNVNAMRQGNFLQHIVSNSVLTLKDSLEAGNIYEHAEDVWAFIKSIKAPRYPYSINYPLAEEGKSIFQRNCARCHGRYGTDEYYPNKIVPADIIQTDSLLWKYFILFPEYNQWFSKSWFAGSRSPAYSLPQKGYVPPPLDGVWVTAPYFHNGSVPTIESVLDSKKRPRYWKRNFNKQEYDSQRLGWKYKNLSRPGNKKTYNTDLPGYGNYGHTFGDHLTHAERKALIEYLKTL